MAKSKIQEKHSKSIEGELRIREDETIFINVEEIGLKKLSDLLKNFNGETIKLSINMVEEITE